MRFHWIFAAVFSVLFPLLMFLPGMLLADFSSQYPGFARICQEFVMAAVLLGALLGDLLGLAPAGLHTPHIAVLIAALLIEGFVLGLILSFAVVVFLPRFGKRAEPH